MTTFLATSTVVLAVPNKFKANGQPAGNAVWRNVTIPAGSLLSFYDVTPWLVTLIQTTPFLTLLV